MDLALIFFYYFQFFCWIFPSSSYLVVIVKTIWPCMLLLLMLPMKLLLLLIEMNAFWSNGIYNVDIGRLNEGQYAPRWSVWMPYFCIARLLIYLVKQNLPFTNGTFGSYVCASVSAQIFFVICARAPIYLHWCNIRVHLRIGVIRWMVLLFAILIKLLLNLLTNGVIHINLLPSIYVNVFYNFIDYIMCFKTLL